MSIALALRDETSSGEITKEFKLYFLSERISVRELIQQRVYQEVDNYNKNAPGLFSGLIQPSESELALNGYKIKKAKKIDRDQQFAKAIDAFGTSSLLVIINDKQAETLDQEIHILPNTVVSFLKLVPLVGG